MSFKKRTRKNIRSRQRLQEEEEEEKECGTAVGEVGATEQPSSLSQDSTTLPRQKSSTAPQTRPVISFEPPVDEGDEEDGGAELFQIKKSIASKKLARELERERKKKEEREKRRAEKEALRAVEENDEEDEVPLGERLRGGYLPDATTIHAIRKQREMARKIGVDYMPLDTAKGPGVARGRSRLVREDEDDKSDDDDDDGQSRTVSFGERKEEAKQMQVLTALENIDSGSEDEETRRWEEDQINKGMKASAPTDQTFHPPSHEDFVNHTHNSDYISAMPMSNPYTSHIDPLEPPVRVPRPPFQVPSKLVPITMETLISRLRKQREEMQELESERRQRLNRVEDDLEAAHVTMETIEDETPDMEREYQFFQELRGYVKDLLSCLAEKAPLVDQLGNRMLGACQEVMTHVIDRRRQDVKDESEEASNHAGVEVIGPGAQARQRRAVEREARRRRRREKREKESVSDHREGMSSDEEILETDRLKFEEKKKQILSEADSVFADVLDCFSRLSLIKRRLEEWKWNFSSSYKHAFISLWLPGLFTPFVKYQLLSWNPLEEECPLLEDMKWYQVLMFFGFREGESPDIKDEDISLVPSLVEQVVIPRLTGLVEKAFDPLSSKHCHRLFTLIDALLEDYPTVSRNSDHTQGLLTGIIKKIKDTTLNDVYIPLLSKSQLVTCSSTQTVFYYRQFWTAVKLLGNIVSLEGVLSSEVVQELAVDGLINRYILLSLQNSPIDNNTIQRTQAVVQCLPKSWFSSINQTFSKSVQSLIRYLTHLARSLHDNASDLSKLRSKMRLGEVLQMMAAVGVPQEQINALTAASKPT